jgi:hypothetical protein
MAIGWQRRKSEAKQHRDGRATPAVGEGAVGRSACAASRWWRSDCARR